MKIERVTSASGIEAWLVQDHSIPVVTLRFTFAGGASLDPPGKDGTAALAASLLDEGAGEYDTTAFHRRLDELAAEMSFSAGHDEFDGTLRMLKANRDESADLLRVALTEPHFADEAVERMRAETLAALAETGPQSALAVGPPVDESRRSNGIPTAGILPAAGPALRRSRAMIWSRSRRASSSATRSSSVPSATLPRRNWRHLSTAFSAICRKARATRSCPRRPRPMAARCSSSAAPCRKAR